MTRRATSRGHRWETESHMCQHVMDTFRAAGWQAFAELHEFDLVLVSPDGTRYGIEAKLKDNMKVLAQACGHLATKAAHHVVVMVPTAGDNFSTVCRRLKLGAFEVDAERRGGWYSPHYGTLAKLLERACERLTPRVGDLLPLPGFHLLEQRAGTPAPRKITKWKIAAVRFCLDHAGSDVIERQMLPAAGLSPGLWVKSKWVVPTAKGKGAGGKTVQFYKLGDVPSRPDLRYPEIADAMRVQDDLKSAA